MKSIYNKFEVLVMSAFSLCDQHYFYENDIVIKDNNYYRVFEVTPCGYVLECEKTYCKIKISKRDQSQYIKCIS